MDNKALNIKWNYSLDNIRKKIYENNVNENKTNYIVNKITNDNLLKETKKKFKYKRNIL